MTPLVERTVGSTVILEAPLIEMDVLPDNRPRIVIQSIEADAEHAASTTIAGAEVTCPAGATITVHALLQDAGGAPLPHSDEFRLPMTARDGRERVLLARMVGGLIEISAPMRESGVWTVTEAQVNERLPAEAQMAFAGIVIFVYEV